MTPTLAAVREALRFSVLNDIETLAISSRPVKDRQESMRVVLLAALAPHCAPAWQPIETAPKDGTEILGFHAVYGYRVCRWSDVFSPPCWMHCDDEYSCEVTHWMPLPAAPKEPRDA